ncbi:MAG: DUF4350 domain-containing protein [Saprospiraceae bacterium]|nr:DUF4350 domain-containing protein [Saprospiraceae bacterium]
MNRRSTYVLLILVGLIAVLIYSLFEFRKVPDVQWRADYSFESKQPYGMWMFKSLLVKRFLHIPIVEYDRDTTLVDFESANDLYVLVGKDVVLTEEEREDLLDFVAQGNDVLFISETVDLGYSDEINFLIADSRKDSTVKLSYSWDSVHTYPFTFYDIDFREAATKDFYSCVVDTFGGGTFEVLGEMQDSLPVFTRVEFDEGAIYCHSTPYVFSNVASKQPLYLDHFNAVFQQFSPQGLIIDHMRYHTLDNTAGSYLQFVLSQKSLRTAYYLLACTVLLYILFRSKRRQRAIPIVEEKKNTTLAHVHTLAHLYLQQDQHKKLVRHLERIFNHKIYQRYFLKRDQPEFVDLLARKSTVEVEEVKQLIDDFDRAKNRRYMQATSLQSIFQKLEQFYRKCK